jgi:hypothetical protein
MSISQTSLAFTAPAWGADPSSAAITILNSGDGTLGNLAASISFFGSVSGWLTATLSNSTAPATLTVAAKTTRPGSIAAILLAPGTYNATINLSASSAAPVQLPVTLHLTDPSPPTLEPPTVAGSTITLRWSYDWPPSGLSSTADAIEVQESTTSATAGFVKLVSVLRSSDATSYVLNRPAATTYYYRVRANTVTGNTGFSQAYPAHVTTTVLTATRFRNNAVWPVISLRIDGTEQFTPGYGILPGNYYEKSLTPGAHNYAASTGFVNEDGSLFTLYNYANAFSQPSASVQNVDINNATINQLLTVFATTGTWCGFYTDPNSAIPFADRCFRFTSGGSFTLYDIINGSTVTLASGTYSLTRYDPGLITFRVQYAGGGPSFTGSLVELSYYFGMTNGPTPYAIQYVYKGP